MNPFAINIEQETLDNQDYRRVLYTTENTQLVVMALEPGEDVPEETHKGTQFIRVEAGCCLAIVNGLQYILSNGDSIVIPPQTKHYLSNCSLDYSLKFYTIYSPPEHGPNEVQTRQ